jgi:hypothetical protein
VGAGPVVLSDGSDVDHTNRTCGQFTSLWPSAYGECGIHGERQNIRKLLQTRSPVQGSYNCARNYSLDGPLVNRKRALRRAFSLSFRFHSGVERFAEDAPDGEANFCRADKIAPLPCSRSIGSDKAHLWQAKGFVLG